METCSGPPARTAGELALPGEHLVLDHKRKLEVSAWSIFGLKKSVYNSEDYGTVVVSTYAAAAS